MSKKSTQTFALLALVIVAVVLPVAAAWFARARAAAAAADKCIDNLRCIDGAKTVWAQMQRKSSNAVPTWDDLRPFLASVIEYPGKLPQCPLGGTYTLGPVSQPPKCSIPLHEYELGPTILEVEDELRRGVAGATVAVTDESGRRIKGKTDEKGLVTLRTWPKKAVSATVSRKGYITYSNTLQNIWTNDGIIQLKRKTE